jgi:quercetin 2,3-dioxygenase
LNDAIKAFGTWNARHALKLHSPTRQKDFMITLRPSLERGYADHGWLKSFHSFSFASYFDPAHMGWGNLRVINEDRIAPGKGFGTHGHQDMEIVSYVMSGALAHKDSIGNVQTIQPGEVQRMSAGSGVRHSEFNPASTDTHFLQIWILPDVPGIDPGYEQKTFSDADKQGRLRLVASPDGADGSVTIHADARMYAGLFDVGQTASLTLAATRKAYVYLVRGELSVNGVALHAGDAALLDAEPVVNLGAGVAAEVLVFDLSA